MMEDFIVRARAGLKRYETLLGDAGKRYGVLLDEAARAYRKACQYRRVLVHPSLKRIEAHNMRHWKKSLEWIDQELAKLGEP